MEAVEHFLHASPSSRSDSPHEQLWLGSTLAPLIEQSYAAEAAAKGYAVSTSESAEVAIKEYRQRNPAARALFGVFSGKDTLATKLTFRGKEYTAEDHSANAIQGMNSLCESVGQQAAAHVIAALKDRVPARQP